LRKVMIAVVALAASVLVTPAADAASGCSATYEPFSSVYEAGWGVSECPSSIQRVMLTCWQPFYPQYAYTMYGPWSGPDQTSVAVCRHGHQAIGASTQFP
jgi:hypothetical protein